MPNWKSIPGYSRYEVSDTGLVRRVVTTAQGARGSVLKGTPDVNGYPRAKLVSDEGGKKTVKIHRLMLLAFIGPPPSPGDHACHNNGVRSDNRLENLRWDSCLGNLRDRKAHGTETRGTANGRSKLTEDEVRNIRKRLSGKYGEIAALAREYSMAHSAMWAACKGDHWSHV